MVSSENLLEGNSKNYIWWEAELEMAVRLLWLENILVA
jgi:hypothetical protein